MIIRNMFDSLIDDATKLTNLCNDENRVFLEFNLKMLEKSQHFFLSKQNFVLSENSNSDAGYGMELPYPNISILSEDFVHYDMPGAAHAPTDEIGTYSIAHFYKASDLVREAVRLKINFDPEYIHVAWILSPKNKSSTYRGYKRSGAQGCSGTVEGATGWEPYPGMMFFKLSDHSFQGKIVPFVGYKEIIEMVKANQTSMVRELEGDYFTLRNLLTLLNTENIRTHMVTPGKTSRQIRKKKGLCPPASYHVLVCNGEKWDYSESDARSGRSLRSHYRRGHIRRLHGGEKTVWVRSTIVKGKTDGFVSKDYKIVTTGGGH
jgi:hypothetical protein